MTLNALQINKIKNYVNWCSEQLKVRAVKKNTAKKIKRQTKGWRKISAREYSIFRKMIFIKNYTKNSQIT
jgi:hypothetical protein